MKGVVHVGAHRGEEVPGYIEEGRSPIICFEPQILDSYQSDKVAYHRCALGYQSGQYEFRVPHHLTEAEGMDTQSASLLPVIEERAIENGWTPTKCEKISVPVLRFDEWAPLYDFVDGSCSLLKIDVQGYELQVLWGFGEYLKGFTNVVVECSNPNIYEGGYSAVDVCSFLRSKGFQRMSEIVRHGDVSFMRVQ